MLQFKKLKYQPCNHVEFTIVNLHTLGFRLQQEEQFLA